MDNSSEPLIARQNERAAAGNIGVRPRTNDSQDLSSAAHQSLRSTGFITWNSMNSNEIEQAVRLSKPKMAGLGDDVKVDKILPTY